MNENCDNNEPRNRTKYVYDAGGIRVAKGSLTSFSCNFASNGFIATTSWVLGPGGEQVTEYGVTGSPGSYTSTWVHSNAFAGGQLLATYYGTDTIFALNDWLGTKRAEIGASGCFSSFTSMPFGDGLSPVSSSSPCPDATEHHFTGKERDAESSNDYFDARYYASSMGRFMSPDWSAQEDPVPYANLDDPQSLNLYSYVRNNPLSRTDPTGHGTCPPCIDIDVPEAEELLGKLEGWFGGGGAAEGGAAAEGAGGISFSAVAIGFVVPFAVADHFAPTVGQSDADEIAERDRLDRENQSAEPQASTGGAMQGNGRGGKQSRLNALSTDPKVSSSDRGWLQNEKRNVRNGKRRNVRVPPGKNLAHRRGKEARKGYDYSHSDLQDQDLHKTQHQIEIENRTKWQ